MAAFAGALLFGSGAHNWRISSGVNTVVCSFLNDISSFQAKVHDDFDFFSQCNSNTFEVCDPIHVNFLANKYYSFSSKGIFDGAYLNNMKFDEIEDYFSSVACSKMNLNKFNKSTDPVDALVPYLAAVFSEPGLSTPIFNALEDAYDVNVYNPQSIYIIHKNFFPYLEDALGMGKGDNESFEKMIIESTSVNSLFQGTNRRYGTHLIHDLLSAVPLSFVSLGLSKCKSAGMALETLLKTSFSLAKSALEESSRKKGNPIPLNTLKKIILETLPERIRNIQDASEADYGKTLTTYLMLPTIKCSLMKLVSPSNTYEDIHKITSNMVDCYTVQLDSCTSTLAGLLDNRVDLLRTSYNKAMNKGTCCTPFTKDNLPQLIPNTKMPKISKEEGIQALKVLHTLQNVKSAMATVFGGKDAIVEGYTPGHIPSALINPYKDDSNSDPQGDETKDNKSENDYTEDEHEEEEDEDINKDETNEEENNHETKKPKTNKNEAGSQSENTDDKIIFYLLIGTSIFTIMIIGFIMYKIYSRSKSDTEKLLNAATEIEMNRSIRSGVAMTNRSQIYYNNRQSTSVLNSTVNNNNRLGVSERQSHIPL